ncbi:MAG: protein kinase [Planctomycetia bacterium]|jgi:serine/threonine protein kinase
MDSIPINTTLLERLALVRPDQWTVIQRRARRLARGLPLVEAVWIDAMLQLGYITPYQAKQLQEADGESLQVGPYVLLNRRESLGWADCFDAYRIEDRQPVYLAVLEERSPEAWESLQEKLIKKKETLNFLHKASTTSTPSQAKSRMSPFSFLSVEEVGIDDRAGVWIAAPSCSGESVAQRMVQHGHFSPAIVLEIARQMVQALKQLESQSATHGDLRATTVLLDREQGLKLLLPGVREVVRPRESFAETEGPINMYDGLSPERAAEGTVADVKSDLFAAGSLWWQMLVGRSPMPGGDGRAKLRAAARGEVEDIRKHAAEVPEPLAQAIKTCTTRDRADRPDSLAEVAKILGPPDARGTRALRRWIRGNRVTALPVVSTKNVSHQSRYLGWAITAAGILVAITALGFAANRFFNPPAPKVVVLPEPPPVTPTPKDPVKPVGPIHQDTDPIVLPAPPRNNTRTIVLDAEQPTTAGSLAARLNPGSVVTGPAGKRARVVIDNQALKITVPKVRFEKIDFVAAKPDADKSDDNSSTDTYHAMIELRNSEAIFIGCTFHSENDTASTPWTVIHWIFPDTNPSSETLDLQSTLPNGRIVLKNCVLGSQTATALHAEVHAAVAVELQNVLHQGVGPMLFLESPPKIEEPWRILADRVTLRESGPFWACRYESTRTGAVRIEANDSVFAPKGTQPLLLFVGENDPEPIFRKLEWTGRETLVKKVTPTAAWQDNRGTREPINDQQASIDGLVRSQIEFVGPTDRSPASSILKTWDAPLTSEVPPGIDAKRLPSSGSSKAQGD